MWSTEKEEQYQRLCNERETYQAKRKALCDIIDEIKKLLDDDKINLTFYVEHLFNEIHFEKNMFSNIEPSGKRITFEYYYKKE